MSKLNTNPLLWKKKYGKPKLPDISLYPKKNEKWYRNKQMTMHIIIHFRLYVFYFFYCLFIWFCWHLLRIGSPIQSNMLPNWATTTSLTLEMLRMENSNIRVRVRQIERVRTLILIWAHTLINNLHFFVKKNLFAWDWKSRNQINFKIFFLLYWRNNKFFLIFLWEISVKGG